LVNQQPDTASPQTWPSPSTETTSRGGPLVAAVHASDLPKYLKRLASKLAAFADANGGQLRPGLTVRYLVDHCRYGVEKRRYSKRTIQEHLHALERVGFLHVTRPTVYGSGHKNHYTLHPEALAQVVSDDPILRPCHRQHRASTTPRQATPVPPPPAARTRVDPPTPASARMAVTQKLVHCVMDEVASSGVTEMNYTAMADLIKWRMAGKLPIDNSGFIYTVLDSAIFQRRRLGLPVPVDTAGTPGEIAFTRHLRRGTSS
jgi:hypothetical protein